MNPSGSESGVADFQDSWAAWLVDQGEACESEMGTQWTEMHSEYVPTSCNPQPPD